MKKIWKKKIASKGWNLFLILLLPAAVLCCTECYTHVPWDLSVPIFLLNLLFYELLYAVCIFLTGNSGWGCVLGTALPMLFGLANYFVVDFRSSPIVPWDLYSIRTAASVAGNYEFLVTPRLVLVLLGFFMIMFVGSRTSLSVGSWKKRLAAGILSVACLTGYVKGIGTEEAVALFGLDTTLFTPNVLYRNNGLAGGFLGILKYLKVETPDGYSKEAAEEIASDYIGDEEETMSGNKDKNQKLPNVIVIMNEAFSDLSVFGDFESDPDYLPFIRSMEENTVKGNCYVSVKGGNTANSEYEFLTGDSMAFMPAGSVPYQQYIKGEMPSLASYMKELGYTTHAIHPYYKTGWARDKVYPWLGFDTATFKGEFEDPVLIRNYISDQSAFEKIIQQYEEKEEDERIFSFEVTMQNHGGYSKDVEGFEESVFLPQLENKTTSVRAAEKYLTLMKETDQAFEQLVRYFENQEEDTIILMFGDHQPSDYITNTILKILGLSRDGSDEVYFDNYVVPFVMWANFDIEEETVDAISVNYLSTLLFEKAGIPMTGYQTFLSELRQEIPAITANMIVDRDGNRYRLEERKNINEELLNAYHILVYNHLADRNGRLSNFF